MVLALVPTFNSIEWIPGGAGVGLLAWGFSFNSIEWIHKIRLKKQAEVLVSIPAFNSIEWIQRHRYYHAKPQLRPPFNSIEWIPESIFAMNANGGLTFNSIEWILDLLCWYVVYGMTRAFQFH